MKIALAQINPTVGDLRGNGRKIIEYAQRAHDEGSDLVVFPELAVTGYPPQDLLDNAEFLDAVEHTIDWIAADVPPGIGVLLGAPVRNRGRIGKRLYNSALFLGGGSTAGRADKTLLPTYDVYDEYRYFEPASQRSCIEWMGVKLGVLICEDMWNMQEEADFRMYPQNPVEDLVQDGAELLISLSATPYARGKRVQRDGVIQGVCRHYRLPLVMANQVGANTDLVFDGCSSVHGPDGRMLTVAPLFEEALIVWDSDEHREPDSSVAAYSSRSDVEDLQDALALGIRDYFDKTGAFKKVVIGLSGGIDSALTCALAAEAIGPDKVVGIAMPSEYSSPESTEDARRLADNLGIEFHCIPIHKAFDAFRDMLGGVFAGTRPGVAEENLQARSRGATLMAVSNKFDYLLLSTGNKSELAVGYVTLYGDLTGGLGVLSDVYKTQVYALAEYVNDQAGRDLIPRRTIDRPPSAELKPNQTDQDALPPYEVLDPILELYVEKSEELDAIVAQTGQDRRLVQSILEMVDQSEYKRRQAPPGLRVSTRAFGAGRRLPIALRWDRDVLRHLAQPSNRP